MKQEYILPMMEVIQFQVDDVVCTSGRNFNINNTDWTQENDDEW